MRNDIYPGYGELAREYQEQVERYDDEVRHLTGRLQGERDRSVEGLDNEKLKLTSQLPASPPPDAGDAEPPSAGTRARCEP